MTATVLRRRKRRRSTSPTEAILRRKGIADSGRKQAGRTSGHKNIGQITHWSTTRKAVRTQEKRKNILPVRKMFVLLHPLSERRKPCKKEIVLWCNGSTSDSGSACLGSNPGRTTKSTGKVLFCFFHHKEKKLLPSRFYFVFLHAVITKKTIWTHYE